MVFSLQFVNNGGSNYIDVDGIRYVSIDFTLFVDGGEIPDISAGKKADAHFLYPIRHKVVEWTDATLADAKAKVLFMLFVPCTLLFYYFYFSAYRV